MGSTGNRRCCKAEGRALMGAGMGAMKRTGNARLPRIDASERKAGGLGRCAGNHGVCSKTRRVPVLCGHP